MYKKESILVLYYIYIFVVSVFAIKLRVNYFTGILLYLIFPAMVFIGILGKYGKKLKIESFLVGLPAVFLIDYMAHKSGAWYENTWLPFRVLDTFPGETVIWSVAYVALILSVYEYFCDRSRRVYINKHFKILIMLLTIFLTAFFSIYIQFPNLLNINGFYSIMLSIFFLISCLGFTLHIRLFVPVMLCVLVLFPGLIIHEIVSVYLSHWYFEIGNHLFYLPIAGFLIPIEEILWFPLTISAVCICHEIFVDNGN